MADCLDMGKPISAARFEAGIAAAFVRYYAEALDKTVAGQSPPAGPGTLELQLRVPRGVVATITPWNYPVINAALKIAPILAAGNTAVLKPSELSPRSALRLAALASEAGVPDGVLNVIPGTGRTGDALARHSDVDMIAFTGSTQTGKALLRATGESTMKPLLLECGGKSPEIVLSDMGDADLSGLAQAIVGGAFANQGQLCVARSRLLLHDSLHDRLLEEIVAAATQLLPADPMDVETTFGPLASAAQRDKVLGYIDRGIEEGAEIILDGRNTRTPGFFVAPTVFANVTGTMRIARDEIFGPVLSVFRFTDIDEAIDMANSSDYGLAATLWTRDLALGHQLSRRIRAGNVKVAASVARLEGAGLSHSGEPYGQSGFGVEGGMNGLETFTRLQSIEFAYG
jgi:gamma-glutamyl-gamma-aminobutyraldehyde dehydrogenase